jgi:hypothetical protein
LKHRGRKMENTTKNSEKCRLKESDKYWEPEIVWKILKKFWIWNAAESCHGQGGLSDDDEKALLCLAQSAEIGPNRCILFIVSAFSTCTVQLCITYISYQILYNAI